MTVNHNAISKVYRGLRNRLVAPGYCPLCAARLVLGERLCDYCREAFERIDTRICRCGLPAARAPVEPARPELCGGCLMQPPAFAAAWPALVYQPPLDRLINQYKHRGRMALEPLLAQLWLAQLRDSVPPRPGALVPLPCHWRRQWRRGFSQTERLAQALSNPLELPVHHALMRKEATAHQQGRSRRARQRSLADAFVCVQPVADMHLALIDDVMTTASTAGAASRILYQAGARRVDIWVLARTPGHGSNRS